MLDTKQASEAVLLVGNGWVNLATGEFTRSQSVRNALATEYDPSATCKNICDWLSESIQHGQCSENEVYKCNQSKA